MQTEIIDYESGGSGANCSLADYCTATSAHTTSLEESVIHSCYNTTDNSKCHSTFEVNDNAISYIAGYMCRNAVKIHDCNIWKV